MMKNKILNKLLVVCIMTFSFSLIGCGTTETDSIATAYEDLYESNFTYTEVHNIVDDNATSYAYNGEFTADPYIKHLTVVQGEALWSEVYAYEVEDELKGVLKVDGEWQEGLVDRTEFIGYENRESIEVLSQEETIIDGVTYTVYDTEYVMDAGEEYDLEEKIEATVSQQYYINKETGKLERIITDATDFERAHNIASLVYAGDTLEDATAKADADKREETVEVVITYQNEDFTLEVPTVE